MNQLFEHKGRSVLSPGIEFETNLPGRLDRLPWSKWHWRLVIGLGIIWLLDGLEVTLVGSVAGVLTEPETLHLSEMQLGISGSAYLAGAVIGSLFFGRLTDMLGRKQLFLVTLGVYLVATFLTAFSWDFISFAFFRALTGAGIGGEYSAMNSAIDELIPARVRGRTNLMINSTYWLGTAVGAISTLFLLNSELFSHALGWRLSFGLGGLLSGCVLIYRRHLPESPRWLLMHGRIQEAEKVVSEIEAAVSISTFGIVFPPASAPVQRMKVKGTVTFKEIVRILLIKHPRRTILGLVLMIAQAFAYNAVFFTYALVLTRFYGIESSKIGLYILPFAIGNFVGPIVLGHFFDTLGRRTMICATYGMAGILLAITGFGFAQGWLTASSQTALWCAVFFVASAAASSAYLTVSEIFPLEIRGMAIALFYAIGTGVGGVGAPALLGALIQTGSRFRVAEGYYLGAALLMIASAVGAILGIRAEKQSLETIAEIEDRVWPKSLSRAPSPSFERDYDCLAK